MFVYYFISHFVFSFFFFFLVSMMMLYTSPCIWWELAFKLNSLISIYHWTSESLIIMFQYLCVHVEGHLALCCIVYTLEQLHYNLDFGHFIYDCISLQFAIAILVFVTPPLSWHKIIVFLELWFGVRGRFVMFLSIGWTYNQSKRKEKKLWDRGNSYLYHL